MSEVVTFIGGPRDGAIEERPDAPPEIRFPVLRLRPFDFARDVQTPLDVPEAVVYERKGRRGFTIVYECRPAPSEEDGE